MKKQYRLRLTKEEHDLIKGIRERCKQHNLNIEDVKHGWVKNKESSLFFKNPAFVEPEEDHLLKLKESLIEDLKKYSPSFPRIKRKVGKEKRLLVIDPADIHIGKLAEKVETGDDYNNDIAVQRVLEGVKGILEEANPERIDKILFIGGNDILHVDNAKRTTTSGTPQDTTGMWHSNFQIAKDLYVQVLEILLGVADVHFVFNPSNHDYTHGYFLAHVVQAWFRNSTQITFDCSIAHRKYFKYYNNLIATTHGDGAKTQDLPLLMAHESPKYWSESNHRYVYTHHVHHKMSKDFIGVTVESLRSPSGTDSWHSRNGFSGAPKAVEGFIHDKQYGQLSRLTYLF